MKAYSSQLVCPRCNTTVPVLRTGQATRKIEPTGAEDNVRLFIEALSSQTRYGLRGEMPLAVLAALKYLCESSQTGVGLLTLIENETHSRAVRHRFIALANMYGRFPNPESSWVGITGADRFELQKAVEKVPDLDTSVSALVPEQSCRLSEELVRRLAERT